MIPRVVTIVQARSGSTRLPGKVLLPLCGSTVLARMVERVRRAHLVRDIVVATTTSPEDDAIEKLCEQRGFTCFRGHATDLLDRHYQAALHFGAEHVVKIPSDCPLIAPEVIDRVLGFYLEDPRCWDYVSNLHPATWPDGNDVEIFSMAALGAAWRQARRVLDREHTTPYFWDPPGRFRVGNVERETGLDFSMSHRFTLDYPEDYAFVRSVFEELYPANPSFSLRDILLLLSRRPDIAALNDRYRGVNWYRHHLGELQTVSASATRFPGAS